MSEPVVHPLREQFHIKLVAHASPKAMTNANKVGHELGKLGDLSYYMIQLLRDGGIEVHDLDITLHVVSVPHT